MNYNTAEKVILFLSSFEEMTDKKIYSVLSLLDKPDDFFSKFNHMEEKIKNILGMSLLDKIKTSLDDSFINSYISNLNKAGIVAVTCFSEKYPEKFKNAYEPPAILFCKGDVGLLNSFCLAIVGCRKPTHYGRSVTEKFARELARNNFTIVSGLAYGIDTIAHESALKEKGKTIAVLGGGFNHIYPASNSNLAKQISEEGLLVSQFPPGFKPTAYSFPIRNRTVALLSSGVLITEASEKSGTMHTKNFALEEGRDVFAVPGNITSEESSGCNRLIRDGNATCVLCADDIAFAYQKPLQKAILKTIELTMEEQLICDLLSKNEEILFDDILEKSKLKPKELNSILVELQIKNLVKKLPNNYYILE